ncbi:unnamed protein product [Pseudo-nitzschia multistriata]|uniref:Uncharacterized protein n=1 Tax=Pseudo-nitzschia multistriata TaxID=183589 RepID=A0A448ZSG5_9STRA|nr:unnamed protein product [Pseudo-nitzschia multistriata]
MQADIGIVGVVISTKSTATRRQLCFAYDPNEFLSEVSADVDCGRTAGENKTKENEVNTREFHSKEHA